MLRAVFGCIDDDFVRADALHAIVNAVAAFVQAAFDLQNRKFIRHRPHAPAW